MKAQSSFVFVAFGILLAACSPHSGTSSGAGGTLGNGGMPSAGGGPSSGGTGGAGGSSSGVDGGGEPGGSGGTSTGSGGTSTGSGGNTGGNSGSGGASGGLGGAGGTSGGSSGAGGIAGTGGSSGTGGTPTNQCTGSASGTAANTLTVNADAAQSIINNGIFAVLMERLGRNWMGGIFVGTTSTIANTDGFRNDVIQAFKDAGVGMIQWPGGCAAGSYNWNANRAPSNDVGTDRYMELTSLLGIPPLIVGPGTAAAAPTNQAWIAYINNNAAHPDWTVNYFKVGNEVWGCGGNQTEDVYETNYLANYNVLSAPVNGKPLALIAGTGLIGNWTWFDTEVTNLAGMIDGVEIHDYLYHPQDNPPFPNVGFSDAQYYGIVNAANRGQIGPRIDRIMQTLDRVDPTKHIKIWEDEWGVWTQPFNSATDSWQQQGTLMDAISGAETLHLFMQHADRYAMAGLAQGINVIQSLLLTRTTDSALVKTPSFYLFKMFLPHHRSNAKWAPNTLMSENITGNGQTFPVLSAGSSVDDQGRVNISLANVDLVNTRTVGITVNSSKASYIASTAQIITGPAKDSFNEFAQTETVNIQALSGSSCSVSGKTLQVTLPARSVVMLVLTPTG